MSNLFGQFNTIRYFFENSNLLIKLLISLLVMFACMAMLSFISMILAMPLFHLSWEELESLLRSQAYDIDLAFLKYLQIIQTVSLFIIPALILNHLLLNKEDNFIRKRKVPGINIILLIIITLVASVPVINLLINWNDSLQFPDWMSGIENSMRQMEDERSQLTEKMLSGQKTGDYIFNIFMIAVLPAIGEEFLFRGVIQKIISKSIGNIHWAIIFAAAIFSIFHMQFFGFIPRLILGIYFGYLLIWSDNIWLPVSAHFMNNTIAVSLDYLSNQSYFSHNLERLDMATRGLLPVVLSIVTTTALIIITRAVLNSKK
ncbi:MAG: CPBP family intramembrane metalloprotease [Bacteroidales bacterium]|nr:CPBP family intramembrane metalloprotease [Bacteroidales bacterium]